MAKPPHLTVDEFKRLLYAIILRGRQHIQPDEFDTSNNQMFFGWGYKGQNHKRTLKSAVCDLVKKDDPSLWKGFRVEDTGDVKYNGRYLYDTWTAVRDSRLKAADGDKVVEIRRHYLNVWLCAAGVKSLDDLPTVSHEQLLILLPPATGGMKPLNPTAGKAISHNLMIFFPVTEFRKKFPDRFEQMLSDLSELKKDPAWAEMGIENLIICYQDIEGYEIKELAKVLKEEFEIFMQCKAFLFYFPFEKAIPTSAWLQLGWATATRRYTFIVTPNPNALPPRLEFSDFKHVIISKKRGPTNILGILEWLRSNGYDSLLREG